MKIIDILKFLSLKLNKTVNKPSKTIKQPLVIREYEPKLFNKRRPKIDYP